MLLKDLYPEVSDRITAMIPADTLLDYAKRLADLNRYKSGEGDLKMRVSWDMLWTCYRSDEICEWSKIYGSHDKHITTMLYKILKDHYPEVYSFVSGEATK